MRTLRGIGVSNGIVIGPIRILQDQKKEILAQKIDDVEAEIARFRAAKETAKEQLAGLYEKAIADVGEDEALLFNIHQMMLDDEDYTEAIETCITQEQVNAEYAVDVAASKIAFMFAQMEDLYMQARSTDVMDISFRVIDILFEKDDAPLVFDTPVVLVAEDLTPSQTIQLDKKNILAFVTKEGSKSSHTAILARTLGIPAIVRLGETFDELLEGQMLALDGSSGELVLEPDEAALAQYHERLERQQHERARREQFLDKPAITQSGKRVLTYANVGNVSDMHLVLSNGAEGIGLFRSEFLYLEGNDFPTEEHQFNVYKSVVETMNGKNVVFRTCDIGADKQADYFGLDAEENPALGLRAIRICLTRPDIFVTQLRALYRASAFGNMSIMFPMIISVDEVRRAKAIAEQVKNDLRTEGIAFAEDIEIGIMIETPAAAIMSDRLAQEVDFFSVGTNDLSQYTLAIDRQNEKISEFFDPHHPAVLELIRLSAENAHKHGIWIGICGELGADLELTERFIEMGIDELSVAPPAILPLREKICSMTK